MEKWRWHPAAPGVWGASHLCGSTKKDLLQDGSLGFPGTLGDGGISSQDRGVRGAGSVPWGGMDLLDLPWDGIGMGWISWMCFGMDLGWIFWMFLVARHIPIPWQ